MWFATYDGVNDLRYLQLLSRSFPTIADASTEIINLEAILNLPKGTEHFLTDIHGEYEAFQHVLKNASGAVKRKVNEIFGHTLRESEKKEICTLIYYPEEKLQLIKEQETDLDDWYLITLNQLVKVCPSCLIFLSFTAPTSFFNAWSARNLIPFKRTLVFLRFVSAVTRKVGVAAMRRAMQC